MARRKRIAPKRSAVHLVCEIIDGPSMTRKEAIAAGKKPGSAVFNLLTKPTRKCQWKARRKFKVARFTNRWRKGEFAIVHPSTKVKGKCQVSLFDSEGAYGDRPRDNCGAALAEMNHREWKLAEVIE